MCVCVCVCVCVPVCVCVCVCVAWIVGLIDCSGNGRKCPMSHCNFKLYGAVVFLSEGKCDVFH